MTLIATGKQMRVLRRIACGGTLALLLLAACEARAGETTTACCDATSTQPVAATPKVTETTASLSEQWGIEAEGLGPSSGGYILDFRFRIVDPEKSKRLLEKSQLAFVIDEKTGAKLFVPAPPKTGPLRSTGNLAKGKMCFILFANPGRLVKSGMKATVVIGDMQHRMTVR